MAGYEGEPNTSEPTLTVLRHRGTIEPDIRDITKEVAVIEVVFRVEPKIDQFSVIKQIEQALQENPKLKAEIEESKKDVLNKLQSIDSQHSEIELLKTRLEEYRLRYG